jgi:hypothetical protein
LKRIVIPLSKELGSQAILHWKQPRVEDEELNIHLSVPGDPSEAAGEAADSVGGIRQPGHHPPRRRRGRTISESKNLRSAQNDGEQAFMSYICEACRVTSREFFPNGRNELEVLTCDDK